MTFIEDMAWEVGLIAFLVLGIIVYLEITLLKFRKLEYGEINFLGSRKPLGGFWIRITDIWVVPFYLSMYKSIENNIKNTLELNGFMMRALNFIFIFGGIYGLYFTLNYIMKSFMTQFKELKMINSAIERRLSVNIIINIVITLMVISGITYTSSIGNNPDSILMLTVIVAEAMLLSSMKSLENSVVITEKGIYLPHMKIKWDTVIDYEWEKCTLIIKRKPKYWFDEIKIEIDEYDVKYLDKYLLKEVC